MPFDTLIEPAAAKSPRTKPKRKNFTQLFVERVKPPARGYDTYWDTNLPGFGLRVSPKGRKTWIAFYRVVGGPVVMESIGTIDLIPKVVEARDAARESMRKARQGIHPVEERKQKKEQAEADAAANAYTYAKLLDDFITRHHENTRPGTISEARRLLSRTLPDIGSKPVRDITDADIRKLRDRIAETRLRIWRGDTGPARSVANGVMRHMRTMFRWALAENRIDVDPTAKVRNAFKTRADRDRVLTDSELAAIWKACDRDGWPFGRITQLLILTGQRVREVGELRWSELDLDNKVWHLPAERAKNHNAHDIPLSDQALSIIRALPRLDDVLVFPGRERHKGKTKPLRAYNSFKLRLDKALPPMPPWVMHDLRRTVATGLQRLGVRLEVTESVLNHVSGSKGGIVGIYQRHDWANEKRAALDAWARFVERLVNPEAARRNVVALAGR